MDFSFSEEQEIYRNSLQKFFEQNYSFEQRARIIAGEPGMCDKIWRGLAELGALALPVPSHLGGLDGSPTDIMVTMSEIGRAVVVEPYLETVVMGAKLISNSANDYLMDRYLPLVSSGELKLAVAVFEPQSGYCASDIVSYAEKKDGKYLLNGRKCVALALPWAHKLIVSARTAGSQADREGISLFLIDGQADGVSQRTYRTVDGRRAGDLSLKDVEVNQDALIGQIDQGYHLLEATLDAARAALCAEAVGGLKKLNEITLDYVKTRKQFGQPIGSFQVIQHRLVDMLVAYEEALSVTYMATGRLAETEAVRSRSVSIAKAKVGEAARKNGTAAIQIHGGIGMTDEYSASHYFKRLTMIDVALGNRDYHIDKLAGLCA